MLAQCAALTHLNLYYNDIGPDGAESLAGVLVQCPSLAHLDLSGNNMGAEVVRKLKEAWQQIPLSNANPQRADEDLCLHTDHCEIRKICSKEGSELVMCNFCECCYFPECLGVEHGEDLPDPVRSHAYIYLYLSINQSVYPFVYLLNYHTVPVSTGDLDLDFIICLLTVAAGHFPSIS